MSSSWMKDFQDRVKKASTEVNATLQPRVQHAKRTLEDQLSALTLKPSADMYAEDERLLAATADLDHLRAHVRVVSASVEAYRARLLELARAEKALADALAPADAVVAIRRSALGDERAALASGLPPAHRSSANAAARFALDMATPMADLARTFEEAYGGKITPLKRRYLSQKGEYLRTVRQAAATDDEGRRATLDELAAASAPLWKATSDALLAEIQSLVSYTTAGLSEWELNVAQAQAQMYQRCAKVFDAPAKAAEKAQNS